MGVEGELSTEDFVCCNPLCPDFNRSGGKNIIMASTIKTKHMENTKRWHCRTCDRYFSEHQRGFRYRLRAEKKELVRLVGYYRRGDTIASISQKLRRDPRTISGWLSHLMTESSEATEFLEKECHLSSDQVKQLHEKYTREHRRHI